MKKLIALMIFICLSAIGVCAWQSVNSFQVGNFTLNVPATNPAVTVQAPARAGTLALREDLPVSPPGATVFAGQIVVNTTVMLTGAGLTPICTLTPRFTTGATGTTTATGLTVTGIDYVCTAKNN